MNIPGRATNKRYRSVAIAGLAWLAFLTMSSNVRADTQQDMLVFLSAAGSERFSASEPTLEGSDFHAVADFLYSYDNDRFRFLAEYIWSDEESELERVKAGWELNDETILWIGRFHTVTNFWTSEYHHGQFMQTSISRPGLEEWEDESGPMPSHITGFWLEHEESFENQSAINLTFTSGFAPKFEEQHLAPFDVLDPESGHDLALSARLTYRPNILLGNQVGLTLSHSDIAVESDSSPALADLNAIRQATIGIFSNWQWEKWRLATNWVYFDVDLRFGSGNVDDDFFLGYIQAEYEAAQSLTAFARTEFGEGEDGSPYLRLLPAVVAHRQMLGLRWDFAESHALTFEIADTSRQGAGLTHDHFKELRAQWSTVFP